MRLRIPKRFALSSLLLAVVASAIVFWVWFQLWPEIRAEQRLRSLLLDLALNEDPAVYCTARDGLVDAGASAIPALLWGLKDGRSRVRLEAAKHLLLAAESREHEYVQIVVPVLFDLLNDAEPNTRYWAVWKLSEWVEHAPSDNRRSPLVESFVARLIDCLEDHSEGVRFMSAVALAELAPESNVAIPSLLDAIADDEHAVHEGVIAALGCMGTPAASAVPRLVRLLEQDEHWECRRSAVAALAMIGADGHHSIPALVDSLDDDFVAEGAAEAIALLDPSGEVAVPLLLKKVKEWPNEWGPPPSTTPGEMWAERVLLRIASDKKQAGDSEDPPVSGASSE
jgi:HEAT repeat protein